MKELPIIMGAESVLEILERRKSQTRRVVNPRKYNIGGWDMPVSKSDVEAGYPVYQDNNGDFHSVVERCPYGKVGDRLWVRESWSTLTYHEGDVPIHIVKDHKNIEHDVVYYAECPDFSWTDGDGFLEYRKDGMETSHWKSPIFMPRWASRITLEITDIRVERVQDITEEDAIAEGISREFAFECNGWVPSYADPDSGGYADYITGYRTLWNSLNAKRGFPWEKNPWVWIIDFKVV